MKIEICKPIKDDRPVKTIKVYLLDENNCVADIIIFIKNKTDTIDSHVTYVYDAYRAISFCMITARLLARFTFIKMTSDNIVKSLSSEFEANNYKVNIIESEEE